MISYFFMKGVLILKNLPEYKFLKELLFFIFEVIASLFKVLKKLITSFLDWIDSNNYYDLFVNVVCLLSIVVLYLLSRLHLYNNIITYFLTLWPLMPLLKPTLKKLCIFFEKASNFFLDLKYYLHYSYLAIKTICANLFFSFISMCISYYVVDKMSDNHNNRYVLMYILIVLFISIIIMVILSLFYNASISKKYKLKYEQATISFTIDFISGILFTLIIGLKTTLSTYFDNTLTIYFGKTITEQFFTEFGITIGDSINLMIYWFFALSLCFQIANKTAKQVMNTKKNDEVESVNKSV